MNAAEVAVKTNTSMMGCGTNDMMNDELGEFVSPLIINYHKLGIRIVRAVRVGGRHEDMKRN